MSELTERRWKITYYVQKNKLPQNYDHTLPQYQKKEKIRKSDDQEHFLKKTIT